MTPQSSVPVVLPGGEEILQTLSAIMSTSMDAPADLDQVLAASLLGLAATGSRSAGSPLDMRTGSTAGP